MVIHMCSTTFDNAIPLLHSFRGNEGACKFDFRNEKYIFYPVIFKLVGD